MSKQGRLDSFWGRLMVLTALSVLVAALFLGAGEWYLRAMNRDKTIILDRSLFEENGLNRIDRMIKRYSPDSIYELQTLRNGTVLVLSQKQDEKSSGSALSIFDLAGNSLIPLVEKEDVVHIVASPDGNSILYQTFRDNQPETVWYDAAEKREKGRWTEWGNWTLMPDDRHSVELYHNYIRVRDLETSESRLIAKVEDYRMNIPKKDQLSGSFVKQLMTLALSPDRTHVFMPFYRPATTDSEGEDIIYNIDLNSGAMETIAVNGVVGDIYDIRPWGKSNVALSGRIGGVEGIYSVTSEGQPKLLKEGLYDQMTYNPVSNMLAYTARGDGRSRVMAATLDDKGLTDEFTVYDNLGYIHSLQWSADGETLLAVTDESTGSNVFQFRMK
ncbi:hypothetical protein [Paenibacillus radicis (ex Gao et al. 2016)]|uniref:WD40 repeat domain-containing protein n=1 Tax=Paenibacillus radicis (ex Gao et al. 2016) TaxID=1737354 RepID=A0A917HIA5_9BACL|nr:hypothetical protein [Paenibacillus radicis (ex Gao et al. 2016)]GGG79446.1 hypothetical protein GCM10010918_40630 [Paenibacillus radicis (ex Gao et al. 2016)]